MTKPIRPTLKQQPTADDIARLGELASILNLLPYFQAHPGRTIFEAAADLGLSPRKLKEYLGKLHCCGPGTMPDELVDLHSDNKQVEIIDDQGLGRALQLTPAEAGALLLALDYLESVPGLVDDNAVRSAAAKLRDSLGSTGQAIVDSHAQELFPDGYTEILREAMVKALAVQFQYHSAEGKTSQREVSVLGMFSNDDHGYIRAWDHQAQEQRTFRADRIHHLELTQQAAQIPQLLPDFDPDDPFGLNQATQNAKLAFKESAIWLAENLPHNNHEWYHYDDGTWEYILDIPLANTAWLLNFVRSNADRVRILEPVELAHEVRSQAKQALTAYDFSVNPEAEDSSLH